MAVLPIRIYPDPVLRVRCPEVETFDDELARLASDLVETMHAAPGIGLAAPQVGVETRLAVVDPSIGQSPDTLVVMVNPEILSEEGKEVQVEGCLSLPEITDRVIRPRRIRLRAQDVTGEAYEIEAVDILARAICHEIDHLDGILFVDHLRGLRKDRARRKLRRLAEEQESILQEREAQGALGVTL